MQAILGQGFSAFACSCCPLYPFPPLPPPSVLVSRQAVGVVLWFLRPAPARSRPGPACSSLSCAAVAYSCTFLLVPVLQGGCCSRCVTRRAFGPVSCLSRPSLPPTCSCSPAAGVLPVRRMAAGVVGYRILVAQICRARAQAQPSRTAIPIVLSWSRCLSCRPAVLQLALPLLGGTGDLLINAIFSVRLCLISAWILATSSSALYRLLSHDRCRCRSDTALAISFLLATLLRRFAESLSDLEASC